MYFPIDSYQIIRKNKAMNKEHEIKNLKFISLHIWAQKCPTFPILCKIWIVLKNLNGLFLCNLLPLIRQNFKKAKLTDLGMTAKNSWFKAHKITNLQI